MQNLKIISALAVATAGIMSTRADSATNSLTPPPAYPWVSSATAGLTLARGNSDLLLFTAKIGTEKKTPFNEYSLGADAAYGETDGVRNADSLHGDGQYNHLFTERLYGFVNVDALKDGIQDIKYRLAVNPGVGYYFIKSTPTTLSGELGPGLVTEKLGNNRSTYASIRGAEHFTQKLSDTAKLFEKAEVVSQASKLKNYYVTAEIGVETAISKKLSLSVVLDDDFVNEPAAGRKQNDVKLVSGITYNF